MPITVGTIIDNKFEVVSFLGEGGIGGVYLAKQIGFDRRVAIKVMKSAADEDSIGRFERECQALAQLKHKNIISVYASGTVDGFPYMAMEHVAGHSLQKRLYASQPLTVAEALSIMRDVCDALQCAHSNGIIHRDLKPSNIMLGPEGVKVIDFGFAKFLPDSSLKQQELTDVGQTVGTVSYMSPEQCTGRATDRRSDIYAAGCVLFHCLAGRPPFVGETTVAIMHQHLEAPAPRLDGSGTSVTHLQQIVDSAMAKDPADRYQNADEMYQEIKLAMADGRSTGNLHISVEPQNIRGFAEKKKRPAWVVPVAAVGALTLAGAGAFILNRPQKTEAPHVVVGFSDTAREHIAQMRQWAKDGDPRAEMYVDEIVAEFKKQLAGPNTPVSSDEVVFLNHATDAGNEVERQLVDAFVDRLQDRPSEVNLDRFREAIEGLRVHIKRKHGGHLIYSIMRISSNRCSSKRREILDATRDCIRKDFPDSPWEAFIDFDLGKLLQDTDPAKSDFYYKEGMRIVETTDMSSFSHGSQLDTVLRAFDYVLWTRGEKPAVALLKTVMVDDVVRRDARKHRRRNYSD